MRKGGAATIHDDVRELREKRYSRVEQNYYLTYTCQASSHAAPERVTMGGKAAAAKTKAESRRAQPG
jgi:hypothetical protein